LICTGWDDDNDDGGGDDDGDGAGDCDEVCVSYQKGAICSSSIPKSHLYQPMTHQAEGFKSAKRVSQ